MEDFKAGIKAINDAMTTPLSDIQIGTMQLSLLPLLSLPVFNAPSAAVFSFGVLN